MNMRSMLATAALGALLVAAGCTQEAPATSTTISEMETTNTMTTAETRSGEAMPAAVQIPRETFFDNPTRTQGRISPDGTMLSWIAPHEGVLNVWVAPVDNPEAARVITNDTYRGIRNHLWTYGGGYILYTQDNGGDENFRVYAADVNTGEVRNLTPLEDGQRGVIQAVSQDRPNTILVGTNARNSQLFDLFAVDLTTGEATMVAENPGYGAWMIDNSLTPRFGVRQLPDGSSEVVSLEDGSVFMSIPAEDGLTTNFFGFNKDNTHIFGIDSRGRDKAALVRMDVATKALEVIAESDKADIVGVHFHDETYEPLAYRINYLREEWTPLSEDFADDIAFLDENVPGDFSIAGSTADHGQLVIYGEAAEAPGSYYLYDKATKALEPLFETRPELARYDLQPMFPVEITARDGLTLVSYYTLPEGSDADGDGIPDRPLPLVLDVHGGPWARDSYGYNSWHQWLANRGYAVLSVNYRGSTGFGKAFINAAVREFAGKMHDDLIDGVNWAVEQGIADADRVAITGGSYGGYATLIGVSFTPDVFACGVDIVGPSSLVTLVESFPDYWKPFLAGTWYKYVGDPSIPEDREDMLARSAITRVDDIRVPLLVGQGENDPRVTKLESDQLVEVMAQKGLPVTYVNFPDEGHGFARPENRFAFYSVMEGFLATCLGGAAEPFGDAFDGSTIQVLEGAEHVEGLEAALASLTDAAE